MPIDLVSGSVNVAPVDIRSQPKLFLKQTPGESDRIFGLAVDFQVRRPLCSDFKTMTDDATLLRHYVEKRSETAFSELVQRHLGLVYGAALRDMDGDSHSAQDVAQAVFVLLAQKAPALCSHPSLAGWLYRTTHFQVSEIRRADRRRKFREQEATAMHEILTTSHFDSDKVELRTAVSQLVLELNERDREAVLLRYFEGQAYSEIAVRLLVSESAAHKRVERALDRLRELLDRRGITSSAAALVTCLSAQASPTVPAGLAVKVIGAAMASPGPIVTFSAIKFMTTTKAAVGVVALVGFFAAGLALHESAARRQSAARFEAANHERAQLSQSLQQLNKDAALVAEDAPASIGSQNMPPYSIGSAATAPAGVNEGIAKNATGARQQTTPSDEINQNSSVHEAVGKLVALNNTKYFGPLLRAGGLSEAQIERAEYLIGQSEDFLGFGATPLSFKTDPRSRAEINAELGRLLGEATTESYRSHLIVRQVIEVLAGNLYADDPLTAQQATQLTTILAGTNQHRGGGWVGWYDPNTTDWPVALAQAQSVLSDKQLAVFKVLASRFGADPK